MVKDIVIAIDPALRRIEDILLWKNKLKTVLVFSLFHLIFWLYFMFNIRTYCMISCVFLLLHLLDAYRTKKRKEINRFKNQANKNLIENISSLGRYVIYIYSKTKLLWNRLKKLKEKNRLQYFLLVFLFWSMTTVIGIKIKGVYLSYFLFWIIFFVPAILHYEVPKKLLRKALPLLQQLDQSMKYERRSILDRNELLVDVKLPKAQYDDEDEQDDEYLNFDDKQRRVLENMEDEDEDEEINEYVDQNEIYIEEKDRQSERNQVDEEEEQEEDDEDEEDEIHFEERVEIFEEPRIKTTKTGHHQVNIRADRLNEYDSEDDVINSLIPDESLPNLNDTDSFRNDNTNQTESENENLNMISMQSGDKLIKRKTRNRPSLQDYYGDAINLKSSIDSNYSSTSMPYFANSADTNNQVFTITKKKVIITDSATKLASQINPITNRYKEFSAEKYLMRKSQQNDPDIDETFDFLDEELKKY